MSGTDSKGRSIGYAHESVCDYPGCEKKINRGLAYACGGEHGGSEEYCEGYYCESHLTYPGWVSPARCYCCAKVESEGDS